MLYYLCKYYLSNLPYLEFLRIVNYISFRSLASMMTALLFVLIIGERMILWLHLKKIRDVQRLYHTVSSEKAGTPSMGGWIIFWGLLLSILLWNDWENRFVQIVTVMAICCFTIGAFDDYAKFKYGESDRGLSKFTKLLLQGLLGLGLAMVILYSPFSPYESGVRTQLCLPFLKPALFAGRNIDLGWFYIPFIIFVFVAISNSVNFLDGMDGLAVLPSALTVLVYGVFAYIIGNKIYSHQLLFAHISGSAEMTIVCAGLIGACLGFLWFNAYPAQIFMGDSGSLFLGGFLATLAILVKQEFLFMIAGGIFVIEGASVFIQMIGFKIGYRIFYRAPIHHTYQFRGVAETKIVIRFWIAAFLLTLISLVTIKIR